MSGFTIREAGRQGGRQQVPAGEAFGKPPAAPRVVTLLLSRASAKCSPGHLYNVLSLPTLCCVKMISRSQEMSEKIVSQRFSQTCSLGVVPHIQS